VHKGRSYPFLWWYWATEAWFWPGFVPWKFRAAWSSFLLPPFDALGNSFVGTSGGGTVVSDRTQAAWAWTVSVSPNVYTLRLSMEQIEVSGVKYARSKLDFALASGGPLLGEAWLYQDFPQYAIDLNNKRWGLVNLVVPPAPYLSLDLRPANYSEAGGYPPPP